MNLRLILSMAAQAWPDRLALGSTGPDGITFGQLDKMASSTSILLQEMNAQTLAFVGVNSPAVPQLLFGAAGAGVPFAPLNYRLSADALNRQIARLDTPVVVADPAIASTLETSCAQRILTTPEWQDLVDRIEPFTELTEHDDAQAPAILLFTSGTTAEPKCVVLRHSHLMSYILGTVEFGSADEAHCALLSVPPYHIAGMGAVMSNTYSGRRVVYLPDFSPAGWLDLVRSQAVSHAMVVPTMLARVVEHLGAEPGNCPSLHSLAYGGARMPLPILVHALDAFPTTDFVNAYGLTETSSTIAVLGPEDHRRAIAEERTDRLTSVGQVVPGLEAEIRGPEGNIVQSGTSGELWVRGPQVSGEYEGLGSVLDESGWFPTRDRARFDVDGFLYLEGRADDTIIRGGENISPAEVEDTLLEHPSVQEAAVIGLPDTDWGERMVAVVVLRDGNVTEEDLRHHVRTRLRGSRTPDSVVFRTELPYTPTGKLLRRRIIDELSAESNA